MTMSVAHQVDTEYLVRKSMNTGYQWFSVIVPPAYIAYVAARRGRGYISINRILRATWVGGLGGDILLGFSEQKQR